MTIPGIVNLAALNNCEIDQELLTSQITTLRNLNTQYNLKLNDQAIHTYARLILSNDSQEALRKAGLEKCKMRVKTDDPNLEIMVNKEGEFYIKFSTIGSGEYKTQFKFIKIDLNKYVIKAVAVDKPMPPLASLSDKKSIRNEKMVNSALRKKGLPHLLLASRVGTLGSTSEGMVTKFQAGGDLDKRLIKKDLSPNEKRIIVNDVLSAVSQLHGENVIHRDIKADNVLLDYIPLPPAEWPPGISSENIPPGYKIETDMRGQVIVVRKLIARLADLGKCTMICTPEPAAASAAGAMETVSAATPIKTSVAEALAVEKIHIRKLFSSMMPPKFSSQEVQFEKSLDIFSLGKMIFQIVADRSVKDIHEEFSQLLQERDKTIKEIQRLSKAKEACSEHEQILSIEEAIKTSRSWKDELTQKMYSPECWKEWNEKMPEKLRPIIQRMVDTDTANPPTIEECIAYFNTLTDEDFQAPQTAVSRLLPSAAATSSAPAYASAPAYMGLDDLSPIVGQAPKG